MVTTYVALGVFINKISNKLWISGKNFLLLLVLVSNPFPILLRAAGFPYYPFADPETFLSRRTIDANYDCYTS